MMPGSLAGAGNDGRPEVLAELAAMLVAALGGAAVLLLAELPPT